MRALEVALAKAGCAHENENPGYTTMTWFVLPKALSSTV
jgi:hypothetical protein